MDWSAACAVVIPCLNEESAIGSVIQGARRCLPTIFVVDDGSQDRTAEIAAASGATVLSHSRSEGKGAAVRTGLAQAWGRGYGWALLMDGDGQHAAEDIPNFLKCAEQSAAALVVGNRMPESSRMPFTRRCVNRFMSWQISRLTGRTLPDSQCGFRLVELAAWERLPMRAAHFEVESEMLVQFARAGLAVEFVPVRVIYKAERSKIHPWRDTRRWLRWWRTARQEVSRR
jgi:glycosyltransferase involved in cell wall biosynthesis